MPEDGDGAELTHTDESGAVDMVDVGDKPDTARRAVARGRIHLQPGTVEAIRENEIEKGDVLATARIGAVDAVKHTWEAIPLCHQIPIRNVETAFDLDTAGIDDGTGADAAESDRAAVELTVAVETTGKTGCEMEALQGVTTGLNVVWDMVKATEKDDDGGYPATSIEGVEVLEKTKRPLE